MIEKRRAKAKLQPELQRKAVGMIFAPGQTIESMRKDQNNKCAICEKELGEGRYVHTDHCHETQFVMSLLCRNCNLGKGFFRDDPVLLRKAADYQETHNKRIAAIVSGRTEPEQLSFDFS